MDISLDNEQVAIVSGKPVTLIPYTDIHMYSNLEDIFATNYVLLNYLSSTNYGHWIGLHKKNNVVTYFDSYGKLPDEQLEYIPMKYRVESDQEFPYLVILMNKWLDEDNRRQVHYNSEQFQRYSSLINTCGRWVGLYLRYSDDYTIEKFEKIMNDMRDKYIRENGLKGLDRDLLFDKLVVNMTDIYL